MTARWTAPAADAANRPFEYRWCGRQHQMPPTAIWITPERYEHGRGRLFLGNVDHALNDEWCNRNQVRQRYHSFHAFVVLRILCGRAAATGRIPSFPAEGPVFRRREGMFCQIASPHHGCEHGLSSRWFLGVSGSRETKEPIGSPSCGTKFGCQTLASFARRPCSNRSSPSGLDGLVTWRGLGMNYEADTRPFRHCQQHMEASTDSRVSLVVVCVGPVRVELLFVCGIGD